MRQELGIKINAENIQEHLCYYFEDTGHNAHKRRPIEIAAILRLYLTFLTVISEQYITQPAL